MKNQKNYNWKKSKDTKNIDVNNLRFVNLSSLSTVWIS